MAFTTQCPACGWTPRVPDKAKGKETKCPECGKAFVAEPKSLQERAVPRWMRFVYGLLAMWR